jgi:hypothetical protein
MLCGYGYAGVHLKAQGLECSSFGSRVRGLVLGMKMLGFRV